MNDKYGWITAFWGPAEWEQRNIMALKLNIRVMYLIYTASAKLLSYQDVLEYMQMCDCSLSQAVLIMHNLSVGTLKKNTSQEEWRGGEGKKMIYSFVSDSSTKNKLKGKKIRMEEKRRRKKNVCWTCSTSGWERSAICACALNTEQCVYRERARAHTHIHASQRCMFITFSADLRSASSRRCVS